MTALPKTSISREQLFSALHDSLAGDADNTDGRMYSYTYHVNQDLEAVAKEAFSLFMSENGLDPTTYPSLVRFENDVITWAKAHLNAPEEVVGSFSSGGTESILLSIMTARQRARALQPEITRPNMLVPVTAHAAFHKAAKYFDVELIPVPMNDALEADVAAMRSLITDSTILLVGSAPGFGHGVMDPIAEIGQLAIEHDLLFHVDGCIGGWLLPYLRRLGEDIPAFDFTVPGVTSISMDLHKYAYTPKGASVLLYKDAEIRSHQFFVCSAWTGYSVINTTMQSTKSGGPLAAAWTVLQYVGDDGYLELARELRDATQRVIEGVDALTGLHILGSPKMGLLAIAADDLDIFELSDAMKRRGFIVPPQFEFAGCKENLHLTITPVNAREVEGFLEALAASADEVRAMDPPEDSGVAAMLSTLDPSTIDHAQMRDILTMVGAGDGTLPDGQRADIYRLLNAMPTPLRDRFLVGFFDLLYSA